MSVNEETFAEMTEHPLSRPPQITLPEVAPARGWRERNRRRDAPPTSRRRVQVLRNLIHGQPALVEALQEERDRADDADGCFAVIVVDGNVAASEAEAWERRQSTRFDAFRLHGRGAQDLFVLRDVSLEQAHEAAAELRRETSRNNECRVEVLYYPYALDVSLEEDHRNARSDAPVEAVLFAPTPTWKRVVDVVGAGVALLLLWPVFLVVGVLIRLGSPGPVFFLQRRIGGGAASFTIWKFRTLRTDETAGQHQSYVAELSQSNGQLTKLDHASSLVPCGRFLRTCCVDELPQLINVLQGTMSLVGPRPDVLAYEDYQRRQRRRFDVVPGMTGWWQVCGKNRTTFDEMIALDLEYVRRRSFWFDLRIMLRTPWAILRQATDGKNT